MKAFVLVRLGLLAGLTACAAARPAASSQAALKQADLDFSREAQQAGINRAFYHYAADSAVLLRPRQNPIVGRETIRTHMAASSDTAFRLTWAPLYADVARSGELGYTYGTYQLRSCGPAGEPLLSEGTYVSIWKKNARGEWKYVLDTGNPGLKPK